MNTHQHEPEISRRAILRAGSMAGAALLLGGCANQREVAALPGPVTQGNHPAPVGQPPVQPAPRPTTVAPGAFDLRPRSAWTSAGVARPGNTSSMAGVSRITVHHDGTTAFTATSDAEAARRLESIRRSHLARTSRRGEPWADIGYHFAVDPSGRVWECRPLGLQGAHVEDQNEHNLGVLVLGNYDKQSPTRAQTAALDAFIAAQMRQFGVPVQRVYTHQEIGKTACPGSSLQRYMIAARASGGGLRAVS